MTRLLMHAGCCSKIAIDVQGSPHTCSVAFFPVRFDGCVFPMAGISLNLSPTIDGYCTTPQNMPFVFSHLQKSEGGGVC